MATNKRPPKAADWDKVRPLYLRGETLTAIVEMFPNVQFTKDKILRKMREEGLTEKKKEIDTKVTEDLCDSVERAKIATNNLCVNLFNTGADVIRSLLQQYQKEIREGEMDNNTKRKATAYNTDLLMSGARKVQEGLRVAYGMDKDGKLYEKQPEVLVIQGLNTDEI